MSKVPFFLLLSTSTIYLSAVNPFLSFAYVGLMISVVASALLTIYKSKIYIGNGQFLVILFMSYLLIFHDGGFHLGTYLSMFFGLLVYLFMPIFFSDISKRELKFSINSLIFFTILLCLVDAYFRYSNPLGFNQELIVGVVEGFYPYKRNSLMFTDSNFTGLMLVCLIGFLYGAKEKFTIPCHPIIFFILFVLIIFTFSRASIITIVLFYVFIFGCKKLNIKLLVFLMPLALGITLFYIYQDGSFQSKLWIIDRYIYLASSISTFDLIVGSGIGSGESVLGIGSHNLFVLLLVEYGLLGFILMGLIFFFSIISRNSYSAYVIIPFMVNGFSLGYFLPFIFIYICLLEKLEVTDVEVS